MFRAASKKFVGTFDAGIRWVDLYVYDGEDAQFHLQSRDRKKHTDIHVGLDYRHFDGVMQVTLHEIMELVFTEMGLRYVPAPDIGRDNGSYFFAMDHTHFSEATGRAALFLAEAMPVLRKEWEKYHAKHHRRR